MNSAAFISPSSVSHLIITATVLFLTSVRHFNFIICHFSPKDQTNGEHLYDIWSLNSQNMHVENVHLNHSSYNGTHHVKLSSGSVLLDIQWGNLESVSFLFL